MKQRMTRIIRMTTDFKEQRIIRMTTVFSKSYRPLKINVVSLQRSSRRRRVSRRNPADYCDVRHVASYL